MKSKATVIAVAVAGLFVVGALGNRLTDSGWTVARQREPALQISERANAAGQGVTLAVLGGFRGLVADALWIQLYTTWETRDLPATDSLIRLVTSIDPRPVYFWLNGARILAYDFAAWRIEAGGGYALMPTAEQEKIGREQAQLALAYLDSALRFHPQSADLWIERANLELNRRHDISSAAENYRRASEQPDAPAYVARVYGELLRRLGRNAEALAWYVSLHGTLPRHSEAANADDVLERIRALERQLKVSPERVYRPSP